MVAKPKRKPKRIVHLEPEDIRHMSPENCSECRKPTRYWLTPHIPLCPGCAGMQEGGQVEGQPQIPQKEKR